MPPIWLIKLGGVLALLAATWWHGHHVGAAGVQADWTAQQLLDQQASEAKAEVQRLRARSASADFEATRTQLQAQTVQARGALRTALAVPACPTGDAHAPKLTLADLPVPAAVVDSLRHAGADPATH